MIYSQGAASFRSDSCIENLALFYFIKLVDWESVIMYSQRDTYFHYALDRCALTTWCQLQVGDCYVFH
jgi:hypothetical protein